MIIPDELTCPLTYLPLVDPVKYSDGRIYSKKSIEDWLSRNPTSPFTREPITPDNDECTANLIKNKIKLFIYLTTRSMVLRLMITEPINFNELKKKLNCSFDAVVELLRFLVLYYVSSVFGIDLSSSEGIDNLWHKLLLCPGTYLNLCRQIDPENDKLIIEHYPERDSDPDNVKIKRYNMFCDFYVFIFGDLNKLHKRAYHVSIGKFNFEFNSNDTIKDLKLKAIKVGVSSSIIDKKFPNLNNDSNITNIQEPIYLPEETYITNFTIRINSMQGTSTDIPVNKDYTIFDLKLLNNDIPPDQQRLIYKYNELVDDSTLEKCGITEDATVNLVLKLRGC